MRWTTLTAGSFFDLVREILLLGEPHQLPAIGGRLRVCVALDVAGQLLREHVRVDAADVRGDPDWNLRDDANVGYVDIDEPLLLLGGGWNHRTHA